MVGVLNSHAGVSAPISNATEAQQLEAARSQPGRPGFSSARGNRERLQGSYRCGGHVETIVIGHDQSLFFSFVRLYLCPDFGKYIF